MVLSRRRFLTGTTAAAGLVAMSFRGATSAQAADNTFTVAVIPDSQLEVYGTDPRFAERTQWLVDNARSLNLAFVAHTGDVVNWDDEDHAQYVIASRAMENLDRAGIPWLATIGNHDTGAVCPGGSACRDKKVRVAVRDTTTFNEFFPTSRLRQLDGVFEAGKVDNAYSTFEAGGGSWLLLSLELWPRENAVTWAEGVLDSHPDHNVIVSTHSYLNADGSIYAGADYGDTTPQQLFERLVRPRSAIKIVLSGHVGVAAHRVDSHDDGSPVASFLGCFHSRTTNPVQLLTIDQDAGTVSTRFFAPHNGETWPEYESTVSGMTFQGSSGGGETRLVALRSRANGLYVTADAAGAQPLIPNRDVIGPWESFEVVEGQSGGTAFRSLANGLIVCATQAGQGPLVANRSWVRKWETFDVVPADGGVALRARVNDLLVCADLGGALPLVANREVAGPWESFDLIDL